MDDWPFPGRMVPVDGIGGTLRTNIPSAVQLTSTSSGTLTIEWWGELSWLSLEMVGMT